MKEADILQVFILFNREKYFNCELLARLDENIELPTRLHKILYLYFTIQITEKYSTAMCYCASSFLGIWIDCIEEQRCIFFS